MLMAGLCGMRRGQPLPQAQLWRVLAFGIWVAGIDTRLAVILFLTVVLADPAALRNLYYRG